MILIILVITIYILKSLDLLYLSQTKEYRIDRLKVFFQEENIFQTLYFRKIRMPALSIRNLLITWGIFVNILPFYFFLKTLNSTFILIFILLAPLIALLTMLLGVLISEIPVQIYRKFKIFKATQMVKNSKTVFIGITGSYGKTSTKEFLYQILSQKYRVAKTDKNYNSEVGVAISILKNLNPDTEYFIAELGAYRKGEIKAACKMISPRYGIITGIGNQHLLLFGSKENLISAKSELLESLPKDGRAYINKDIKEWKILAGKTSAKIHYYSASKIPLNLKTNLSATHNIQNLLPCIALATDLGMETEQITKGLTNLKPLKGRLSQELGLKGSLILDDSYNSNVEGFLAAINVAGQMNFEKKFILSRGLIELGAEKKSSYQKIIDQLNSSDLTLLTTDKLFKTLDTQNNVEFFQEESQLLKYMQDKAAKNTLIVIEGRFEPRSFMSLRGGGTTTKQSR